jgi:predicted transcriptional regulator
MNKKMLETLRTLGISQHATDVYMTLLAQQDSSVAQIVRATRKHRPDVYRAIKELIELQFVHIIQKGKRVVYRGAHPERLAVYAQQQADAVIDIVPFLTKKFIAEASEAVQILEGKSGIAAAYMDVVKTLPPQGMFYHYTAVRDQEKVDSYVPREYREVRDRKELERLTIASEYVKKKKTPRLERYLKVLGKDSALFAQNVDMFIYEDKIAILSFDDERAVIIHDAAVADFQKRIFQTLFTALP